MQAFLYVVWAMLMTNVLVRMYAAGRVSAFEVSMIAAGACLLAILWWGKRVDLFDVEGEEGDGSVEGFAEDYSQGVTERKNLLLFKDSTEPIINMVQTKLASNNAEQDWMDLAKNYEPVLFISSLNNDYIHTSTSSSKGQQTHTIYNALYESDKAITGLTYEGHFFNTTHGITISKRAQGLACNTLFANYDQLTIIMNVNFHQSLSASLDSTVSLITLYANNIANWKFLEIIVTPTAADALGANIVIKMCGTQVSKTRGVKNPRNYFGHIGGPSDYNKGISLLDGKNHTITFVKDRARLALYIDEVEVDLCANDCFTKNDHYRAAIAPEEEDPLPSTKNLAVNSDVSNEGNFSLRMMLVYNTAMAVDTVRRWHRYLVASELSREPGVQNLLYSSSQQDIASRYLAGECVMPAEVCESAECKEFNMYNERGWNRIATRAQVGTPNATCMKKLIDFCSDENNLVTYNGSEYMPVIESTCGWVASQNIDNMMRVKNPEVMFYKDRSDNVIANSDMPHSEKLGLKGISLDPSIAGSGTKYDTVMRTSLDKLVEKTSELGAHPPIVERDDKLGIIDYDTLLQDTAQSTMGTMPSFENLYNHLLRQELGSPERATADVVEKFTVEEEGESESEDEAPVKRPTDHNFQKYKRIMSAYKTRKLESAYKHT